MPLGIQLALAFAIGSGLGLFIGWLLGRGGRTTAPADLRLEEELRQQIAQGENRQRGLQEQLRTLDKRNGELDAELKSLGERLATERQQLETIQEKFRKEFEAVSNKLILDNASRFNQQSTESLGKLLTPLKETLGEFKTSLDTTRKETATHSALLKDQISRIGAEAASLSKALKGDVKALGNWGENMLDQILEKSGLQRDVHYRRQRGAKDMEGDQRFLDVIVDFPEKKGSLIIDSKVSLRAYEESVNAADDTARLAGLERHIESIRKHFKDLGAKRYQDIEGIKTPDFVLMYVPVEAAFFAAIAREPGLFAEALDRNVVLITNSTLLATLRTVAHVWRLADQQKHVLEIADRGGKLYDKFAGFVEDLQAVGDSLGKARKSWEDASTKLHTGSGNLVSQAEKLKQLGAKAAKSLPNALVEKANEGDSTLRLPPA
ncbi:MAG: DNA recombination protein RmuC [Verrucomicrobiia bacterium]